jgi:hypothetical protein
MTLYGWLFMLTSWAIIIGLFSFCMYRTLKPGPTESSLDMNDGEADQEKK